MRERSIRTLNQRFAELKTRRIPWERDWRSIQKNQLPQRGRLEGDARIGHRRGERREHGLMDETGEEAADKAAAGLFAGLTSPSQPWHREGLADKDHELTNEERVWLDRNAEVKRAIWRESGVYNVLRMMFLESPGFGTATGVVFPDYENVIRLMPLTVGEYWLSVDARDRHDELIYRRELTSAQILGEFFDDDHDHPKIPQAVRMALRHGRGDIDFTVLCYIGANPGRDGAPGQRGKPWVSEYWLESGTGGYGGHIRSEGDDAWLKRSGFSYKPLLVAPWESLPGDAYGRGCGHKARAACAQLQHLARTDWRVREYLVTPPLQGPAWANDRETDLRPGAYNPIDNPQDPRKIESLWNVRIDPTAYPEVIEKQQRRVRSLYYNDILAAFMTRGGYQITAMEAGEISQEKLTLFAPIANGFIDRLLIPLNEATQAIMEMSGMYEEETGLVGPPPESIAGKPIDFEFLGPLAQAMKLLKVGQLDRLLQTVGANQATVPGMAEELHPKRLMLAYTDGLGVDATVLKTAEEKKADAKARAEMMEREKLAQMAELSAKGAGAAKTLSETPLSAGGTALDALGDTLLNEGGAPDEAAPGAGLAA